MRVVSSKFSKRNLCVLMVIITTVSVFVYDHLNEWNFPGANYVIHGRQFFQTSNHVVNAFNQTLLLHNPTLCSMDSEIVCIIIVLSAFKNVERRNIIRETWGTSRSVVKIVFVVGVDDKYTSEAEFFKNETRLHKDIIMYDTPDLYKHLQQKVGLGLKWATQFCRHAKFLYKTDDDMFVQVNHLLTELSHQLQSRALVCCCRVGSRPYRYGKWKVTRFEYPFDVYPTYCTGSGYVMSMDVVATIFHTAQFVPFIPPEDVYFTGIVSRIARIKPINHRSLEFIHGYSISNICRLIMGRIHTLHGIKPEVMSDVWREIHSNNTDCHWWWSWL